MLIYYVLISGLILIYLKIEQSYEAGSILYNKQIKSKVFMIYAAVLLAGVMALRAPSVGTDTSRYLEIFTDHLYGTGMKVFSARTEWLYTIFSNTLSIFVSSQMYLAIVSIIIALSFSMFYYKYSDNIFLCFILHITIGLFSFTMSGIRQSLAICMIFLAFKYAKERKLFKFIITMIIASLFHDSAMCFLPVYIVVKIKRLDRLQTILILAAALFSKLLSGYLILIINILAPYRYKNLFGNSSGINSKSFILYFGIMVLCSIILLYENDHLDEDQTTLFILGCVTAVISGVATNVYLLDRLSFYFIPFSIVFLSNTIKNMKDAESRRAAIIVTVLFGIIWFSKATPGGVMGIDHYMFFWS